MNRLICMAVLLGLLPTRDLGEIHRQTRCGIASGKELGGQVPCLSCNKEYRLLISMRKFMSGVTAFFLHVVFTGPILQAKVVPYPRLPGQQSNSDMSSIKVNGIPVDVVSTEMNVGYAHFAFSGTVAVEVTAKEVIKTFDLSPHRYGIQATTNGNVLSFRLSQPRKLHLKINNLPRLFIFAEAPEANPPRPGHSGVHDIGDYGVTSSLEESSGPCA